LECAKEDESMWNIIFYEKEDGKIPVQDFLDKLLDDYQRRNIL